jgi:hypothetical protein
MTPIEKKANIEAVKAAKSKWKCQDKKTVQTVQSETLRRMASFRPRMNYHVIVVNY